LLVEIFSPFLEVTVPSLHIEVCCASSKSTTITWSSADKSVFLSLFIEILIPFIYFSLHSVIFCLISMLNKVGEIIIIIIIIIFY
jgi:hypothetical protein